MQKKMYYLFPSILPATKVTALAMGVMYKVMTEGMMHSEKRCRKLKMGGVP